MWSFSKCVKGFFCLAFLMIVFLFMAGCVSDNPTETDMPWSAPASWEGTMPMPGGYLNRYE